MLPILDLLRADGSIIINKKLAKKLGLETTIVYSELLSRFAYFEERNQLTPDGYFFNTVEDLERGTTLSDYQQRKAITKLEEFGLIKLDKRDVPQKRYFYIVQDLEVLLNFLGPEQKENEKEEKAENMLNKQISKNLSIEVQKNRDLIGQKTKDLDVEKFDTNNNKYNNTKKDNNTNTNIITGKAPVIEKNKNTSLFSETNKQFNKQKRFKEIQNMKDMILGYTNNKHIRDKLTEYFTDRVKKRLQINQWQIILADLKNYCGENQELTINQINSAIAGGYMTIIPAWEKNKKFTNNRNNFDNTSKKVKHRIAPGYGEIAEEVPKNISSERF